MPGTPRSTAIREGQDTARFASLLAALVAVFVLPPVLQAANLSTAEQRIGLTAVLLASLFVVSRRRRTLWIGLALAGSALLLDWASVAAHSRSLAVAAGVLATAFLALVIVSMVRVLLAAERVTTDTILGGICVYLLLGLLWGTAYTLVENLQPGSLLLAGAPLAQPGGTPSEPFRYVEILYFSFVTLTTLGYGDVVPATSAARALATSEAVVGQLYVAIFVARLVGLHLAHSRQSSRE